MSTATVRPPVNDRGNNPINSKVILSQGIFEKISQIVYKSCGIRLFHGKEELVRSRLIKRLRVLDLPNFETYMRYVDDKSNQQELKEMIDSLTTNKTSFFREIPHFEYMRTSILPGLINRATGIRIWSAGCSSGQEPYSIAMLLSEEWPYWNRNTLRILGTDISVRVLEQARKGEYEQELLQGIPENLQEKYFRQISSSSVPMYRVKENIKEMVSFANLNLMASWPMNGSFDLIFCRNVMIYFDPQTQRELVCRFYEMLVPGGYLMVGHSESLIASSCDLKYVQPATYRKE